jgi:anti-anti-sigma factor
MDIQTAERDGVTIVKMSGRLDSVTAAAVEPKLPQGRASWVLDMADVAFVSSAGIRVILTAAKLCRAQGGNLYLAGMTPQVLQVFKISGLLGFLNVTDTVAAALEKIAAA